jgi:hypothetical protein
MCSEQILLNGPGTRDPKKGFAGSHSKAIPSSANLTALAIFTDQLGLKTEPVVPMLRPFLHGPDADAGNPDAARYSHYFELANRLFQRVDRGAAEIAVLPWDWNRVRDNPALVRPARRFIRENAAAGLRTLVFSVSDPEAALREPQTILFRTSLIGRKLRADEHAMPAWGVFVPGLSRQNLSLRSFEPTPTVGFCGASYRSGFREPNWFRRNFRPWRCQYERVLPKKPGLRAHVIDRLRKASGIKTNIVERERFLAGALQKGELNLDAYVIARHEYVQNLLASDYALCVRGGGNFSFRLYEALQLGRIPLFINTDCVLPWPEHIPWRSLCVWVEQAELDGLEETLLAHHRRLGRGGFEDQQRQCRAVWEDYLSPSGFFTTLRAWLQERGHCRNRPKT